MKKILIWIAVSAFAVISIAIAITHVSPSKQADSLPSETASDLQADTEPESQTMELNVNGLPVFIDLNLDGTWYDLQQMTTEFAMPICVGALNGYQLYIDGVQVEPNSMTEVKLEKLDKLSGISIKLVQTGTGNEKYYYIRGLHQNAPSFTTLGEGSGDGYYYFTNSNFLFKMNSKGDIVYYRQDDNAVDFKCTEVDGKRFYSYLSLINNVKNPQLTSTYATSKAVIMNEQYQVIDIVNFLSTEQGMPEMFSLESHEFSVLGEGHYLLSAYVGKLVHNVPEDAGSHGFGSKVLASVFQEIKDGKLVFQWDSTEHPELYALSNENNDYKNEVVQWSDYAHLNSIQVDPVDGNYICSFRQMDAVMKISREDGEIVWILGGDADQFGLTDEQKMYRQHFARISEERRITVFDNHTVDNVSGYPLEVEEERNGMKRQSRIVEYTIDEETKTLTEFHEYYVDGTYSSIMGSAQRLSEDDNTFLICWGGRDTGSALFSEVNFDEGKILFEVMYQHNHYGEDTYRAYKFDY